MATLDFNVMKWEDLVVQAAEAFAIVNVPLVERQKLANAVSEYEKCNYTFYIAKVGYILFVDDD